MTATANSAAVQFDALRNHLESIKNDDPHVFEHMDVGDMWAQGDVGIMRIELIPKGVTEIKNPSAQLAPGSTQGSRHIIADMAGVRMFSIADATALDGPIVDCKSAMTITHPEHGDVTVPAGTYAIVYQRAFADELKRQKD